MNAEAVSMSDTASVCLSPADVGLTSRQCWSPASPMLIARLADVGPPFRRY